jgi:hypothetical protein
MNANIENALKILYKSGKLLGEDDPVFIRWQSAMKTLVNARDDIGVFIEKGKIIEEF